MPTRRFVLTSLAALAACGPAPDLRRLPGAPGVPPGRATAAAEDWPAVANPGFDAWKAGFAARARAAGIPDTVAGPAVARAGYIPKVIERDRNQTEFTRSIEDYLALAVSDARLSKGQAALARHRATLDAIAARYGVAPQVVAAVWGLESMYGERRGAVPVVSALATLAYDGRRGAFFERQLIAALRILQAGDVPLDRMTGSWAGAMGHTQFIPTSYLAYAVDFTGDGRRDIWADDPADALASTAAYLDRFGWRAGQPWGMEVTLGGYDGPFGRGSTAPSTALAAAGVRPAAGGALPDHGPASVLRPGGSVGPAFVVWANFGVLLRYNNAESYALGVGHLSDRLAGGGPIRAAFPPDAEGLTLADRRRLQQRLSAAGYDTGGADGVIGPATEAAIRAYQAANGLPVTGRPSPGLLARLG